MIARPFAAESDPLEPLKETASDRSPQVVS